MSSQNRVQAGIPTGGQFSQSAHAESDVSLDGTAEPGLGPEWDGLTVVDENVPLRKISINRRDSGVPTDGPNGEPAVRTYRKGGALQSELHITDGKLRSRVTHRESGWSDRKVYGDNEELQDRDGMAAVSRFDGSGQLVEERHFSNGRQRDLPDGTPHRVTYHSDGSVDHTSSADGIERDNKRGERLWFTDPRDGSSVRIEGNERAGLPVTGGHAAIRTVEGHRFGTARQLKNDGPGGEPAVTYRRADGTISSISHYRDGKIGKTIDYFPDGTVASVYGEEGVFEED